ncbi:hypothetical protein KKH39_02880 [Patescibacteria group bacterium]|nr:hypothetical protein [Patescibacteria group bacterium]
MSIQNIFLLIAAIVNLLMSIVVFSRGIKNKVNLYFGLLTFFNFLWALGLILVNLAISYEFTRFFASFVYPVALMVVVSLYYFIVYFPYKTFELPKLYKNLITFFVGLVTLFCIGAYKIFVQDVSFNQGVTIFYEMWSYTSYSILLVILMILGIAVLFSKIKKAEGIFKVQLKLILIAVIIGTAVGSYSNLFMMYFYNCQYNHLGPLFTLFINFVVFYFIFFSQKSKQLS